MNTIKTKLNLKQVIFLLIFFAIIFGASRVALFKIVGSKQAFTLFEFLYPLPAAFLGSFWGAGVVLLVKILNWLITGQALDLITFIRFFPAVLAAIYFSTRSKLILLVPIICMILFWLNPIGLAAFPYGLFWLIPLIVFPFKKNLALNSLGTTFTAHAVGSVAFLYSVPMTAEVWRGLIPVVIMERFIFAAGISVSYLLIRGLVKFLVRNLKSQSIKKIIFENIKFG